MQLHLLSKTPCLSIYYDSKNNWLFLDWEGELTLPAVQVACVELARCFLHRPYPRVLNNNTQVTGVSWSVATWLVREFLPHLPLAGVEQVAWVSSASLLGRNMVQTVVNWLPWLSATLFDDLEAAVHWLRQVQTSGTTGFLLPQRLPATQAKLAQTVQELQRKVAAAAPPHQPVARRWSGLA
ncbi:hypothetical protein GO988_15880 [Hymenobacter sp. HMF4947]|uniref:STAS/SEC14 domain-containing protein n=1 Tax=Hymenobacter ginkgonis TaxID=2682976 RepID=A0A7K1TI20_9BACT|nr:STAS/SEC14 domain-containing protein [Hymenobacter ginkgonis]MVN77811.1 hypothetical protein [Hymenobacter ginkgonis]